MWALTWPLLLGVRWKYRVAFQSVIPDSWLITVAGRPGPKKNQVLQWLPRPPRAPGSAPPLTGIDIRTAFTSIGLGNVRGFTWLQSEPTKTEPAAAQVHLCSLTGKESEAMVGENRQLGTDEPVKLEK